MEVYFVEFKLTHMYSHNTENTMLSCCSFGISKAFSSVNVVQRWAWQARSPPMRISTKAPLYLKLNKTETRA